MLWGEAEVCRGQPNTACRPSSFRRSFAPGSWNAKHSGTSGAPWDVSPRTSPCLPAPTTGPPPRRDFLKRHPGLLLDTRHFERSFVDELLAAIDGIDENTDGLAIRSENWQALNLVEERYRRKLACVYIDPPYNSKTSEILYKNSYKHSSWLSLMEDRLLLSRLLVASDGSHIVAIDENEQEVLGALAVPSLPGTQEGVCKRCPQQERHPRQLFLLQS